MSGLRVQVLVEDVEDAPEAEGGDLVDAVPEETEEKEEKEDGKGEDKWQRAHPKKVKALTAEEAETTPIDQVVLPLPGVSVEYPSNALGQRYKETLEADGLDITNLKHKVREYTMSGDYRKLMGRPADVEWELLRYKNPRADLQATDMDELKGRTSAEIRAESDRAWEAAQKKAAGEGEEGAGAGEERRGLRVGFTLKSSQYATMCLRELLKHHSHEAQWGAAPPGAGGPPAATSAS